MKSFALVAGALFIAGTAAQQANLPAPLAKDLDTLAKSPSLTVTYTFRVVGDAPADYKLEMAKPNLFRLTTPDGFTLSDGKTLYTYIQKDNKYTEEALTEDTLYTFLHRPELFGWADMLAQKPGDEIALAKLGPDRTIKGGMAVSTVEVTMKKGTTVGTLFIDKKSSVPFSYTLKMGDKDYLATASAITLGKETLTADKFAFSAPAGAQKQEVVAKTSGAKFADVQAIMNASCMPCHSAQGRRGGYDLSTYEGIMTGVTAGNSAGSRIYQSIKSGRMPRNRPPLSADQQATIASWIDAGAKKE